MRMIILGICIFLDWWVLERLYWLLGFCRFRVGGRDRDLDSLILPFFLRYDDFFSFLFIVSSV